MSPFFANRANQLDILPTLTSPDEVTVPYAYKLVDVMHKDHDVVTGLIQKADEKQARFYNKSRPLFIKSCDIDDKVYLSTVNMLPTKAKKFYPCCVHPFEVVK